MGMAVVMDRRGEHMKLQQIEDRGYDAELKELGTKQIFKLGIAFSGKHVKIVSK